MVKQTEKLGRSRTNEMPITSHTEKLTEWINKVHHKKKKCYTSPKRDFRVQAVLTYTLNKAKYELRTKQLARMVRWQRLKKDLLKGVNYGSCALYHAIEAERKKKCLRTKEHNFWQEGICEELRSLDIFLQQLGEIKSLVQRLTI